MTIQQSSPQVLDKEDIIKVIGRTALKFLSHCASKDIKIDRTFGIKVEMRTRLLVINQSGQSTIILNLKMR